MPAPQQRLEHQASDPPVIELPAGQRGHAEADDRKDGDPCPDRRRRDPGAVNEEQNRDGRVHDVDEHV